MLFNVLLYLRIALTQETKEWQYSSKGCAVSLPCDRRVKEATYLGLVRPLLEYASQTWDPCTDNLSNEIEKIQRRAARFVTSDYQNYEQKLSDTAKFIILVIRCYKTRACLCIFSISFDRLSVHGSHAWLAYSSNGLTRPR